MTALHAHVSMLNTVSVDTSCFVFGKYSNSSDMTNHTSVYMYLEILVMAVASSRS